MTGSMWIRFGFTARVIAGVMLGTATLSSSAAAQVPGPSRTFVSVGSCLDLSHESGAASHSGAALHEAAVVRADVPDEAMAYLLQDLNCHRKGHRVTWGAVIGGAAGFLIGCAVAKPDRAEPGEIQLFSEDAQRVMMSGFGLLAGAGVGALIGMALTDDRADDVE